MVIIIYIHVVILNISISIISVTIIVYGVFFEVTFQLLRFKLTFLWSSDSDIIIKV